jgi:hypothetical protein
MNPRKITITILATLFASLGLADDCKTIGGKEYKDATVTRVEPIWIVDAHRDDGRRFVVHADEKLTAFLELERAVCIHLLSEQC